MRPPERALPQARHRIMLIGMAATLLLPLPGRRVATNPEQPDFCPRKESK